MAETWRIVEADWGQGLLREGEEADRIGYLQRVDNLIRNGAVRVAVTRCERTVVFDRRGPDTFKAAE